MVLVSVAVKLGCKFNAAVLLILFQVEVSHAIFALLRTPSVSLPVLTLISTSAQLSWRQSAPWRDPCHRVSQNRAFHLRTHP